ncbi:NUDIX domain-containing protein [Kineosporia rhizophila]|uniref:NUDIX domain-containing protein n=1 Tax=Kineosporia TaxID=49184 RepID=UPI001E5380EC|nr:NUDIX domain-containing protein [Kineosporia sp. NBRC 101677]MCE0538868.1 NUDIX domain-containing protein [Kineosporia rhizophila]
MATRSAAMLVYRFDHDGDLEVLIAHMGGPLWAHKEDHAWSIPKGLFEPGEDALTAALREFQEEMGSPAPEGPYLELGDTKQSSGKVITTFAVHGEHDVSTFSSNLFEMEWPRGSGQMQWFPEMDRAAWFDLRTAATKLVKGQLPILEALSQAVHRQTAP